MHILVAVDGVAERNQIIEDLEREASIVEDATETRTRLITEYEKLAAMKDTSAALDAAADMAAQAIEARNLLDEKYTDLTRITADQKARQESTQREVTQLERRLTRLKQDYIQNDERLQALQKDDGDSANLFAAAAKAALEALQAARTEENKASGDKSRAEQADQEAREALAQCRQALSKLTAEQSALQNIVSRGGGTAWTAALDHIQVDAGYEQALSAVLGEDLDAAINEAAPMRWTEIKTATEAQPHDHSLPAGVSALSQFVSAPKAMAARLAQIGVADAAQIESLAPQLKTGQRLVTKAGHVIRWDGFTISAGAETSAAIKLKQQNRLIELDDEITIHEAATQKALEAFENTRLLRKQVEETARNMRKILPDLERRERAAQAGLSQYETDIAKSKAETRSLEERLARIKAEIAETDKQRLAALEMQASFVQSNDLSEMHAQLGEKLHQARDMVVEASSEYRSLKNEADARLNRLKAVETELSKSDNQAKRAAQRIENLKGRQERTHIAYQAALANPGQFDDRRKTLFNELAMAEKRGEAAADNLQQAEDEAQRAMLAARDTETQYNKAREDRAGAAARLSAAQDRIEETKNRINETLNCLPSALKSQLGARETETGLAENEIERKLSRLNSERDKLGSVNLRADIETAEQESRLAQMHAERQDLLAAIARLREAIDALNSEGRERLLQAFEKVNDHFGRLFVTLFGGGEAALALTESDDPLEAGLEVMAAPSLSNQSMPTGAPATADGVSGVMVIDAGAPPPSKTTVPDASNPFGCVPVSTSAVSAKISTCQVDVAASFRKAAVTL